MVIVYRGMNEGDVQRMKTKKEIQEQIDHFEKSLNAFAGDDEDTAYQTGVIDALEWVMGSSVSKHWASYWKIHKKSE